MTAIHSQVTGNSIGTDNDRQEGEVEMSTPTKVGETLWTAKVSTLPQLAALDMDAPLTGHDEARRRAQALRERRDAERTRRRGRPRTDVLRKLVR
ncbi:MAG TPA: hypothetical protein VHE35_22100 [Kofleriaceae bacterium]|nr:hypothetical protein [Kofleriaceae bacterium]